MSNAFFQVKSPQNEPIKSYKPGSPERASLKAKLEEMKSNTIEIPLIIGGKEVKTGNIGKCVMPHNHEHVLCTYHIAGEKEIKMAIDAAMEAKEEWENMPFHHRASIFLKAAELLAGPYRDVVNAATMLGQSKTVQQAEIDSACELIDFFRFNTYYLSQIYNEQVISTNDAWNRIEYRALEGFVFAISPFNFTAIGGNLTTSPAMAGNVVLWKPASTAVLSNYFVMKVLIEAGLPEGVINFIPGPGALVGDVVFKDENLAGIHFTGSTGVFNHFWKTIGDNINKYKSYPRIVGETGGKDFIFAHKTADVNSFTTAIVRGAFEYQGQKCSAASRAYIPQSIWSELEEKLVSQIKEIKMGDVEDFENFISAVIDRKSFDNIKSYIDFAKQSDECEIIVGGVCNDTKGYFIEPTVVVTSNPQNKLICEEIFGPVLTVYIYEDDKLDDALELCDTTSGYALTGAVFARDRKIIKYMEKKLTHSAGNFYINDKPTGAVVGQQPFGGARGSGTNDKAGSKINLYRWISQRTVKENFVPPTDFRYPNMEKEN